MKDSDKDKSKTSVDDTTKLDRSTVGISEGKKVDSALKVTEESNTFDTSQKDAGDKKITQNAKNSGGSATKRSISKTLQDGKDNASTSKRSKRKTIVSDFLALIKNNFKK